MNESTPEEATSEIPATDSATEESQTVEMTETPPDYSEIIKAINDQTAAIHLQFAILIAVLLVLRLWRRGR